MNKIEIIVYLSSSILFIVSLITIGVLFYLSNKKNKMLTS